MVISRKKKKKRRAVTKHLDSHHLFDRLHDRFRLIYHGLSSRLLSLSFPLFPFHSISSMLVDKAIQTYQRLFIFLQDRKNKYACICAAIACILSHHIYRSIALPPEHLRSFPRVSTFAILNSFRNFESVPSRIKRLINPITDAGYSFYMVCVYKRVY